MNEKWYLDSGCSRHMMGDRRKFSHLQEKEGGMVSFEGKDKDKIIGQHGLEDSRALKGKGQTNKHPHFSHSINSGDLISIGTLHKTPHKEKGDGDLSLAGSTGLEGFLPTKMANF